MRAHFYLPFWIAIFSGLFSGSIFGEFKVVPPVPVGHVELTVVDASAATAAATVTASIQTKFKQVWLERREAMAVDMSFSYNRNPAGKVRNEALIEWLKDGRHVHHDGMVAEDALLDAVVWSRTEWKSKTLNLRWFTTGDESVSDETLDALVKSVNRLDVYHVGEPGKTTDTGDLIDRLKALSLAEPGKVAYHRVVREVEMKSPGVAGYAALNIPVAGERELAVIDFSSATIPAETTKTIKSIENWRYWTRRNHRPVDYFYSYNRDLTPMNVDLHKWVVRYNKSYRGRQSADLGLEAALAWFVRPADGTSISMRWYMTADEDVPLEILNDILDGTVLLEIFHVGAKGTVPEDNDLVRRIKALALAKPALVRYYRVDEEVPIAFKE
jgi:hypothetical protein